MYCIYQKCWTLLLTCTWFHRKALKSRLWNVCAGSQVVPVNSVEQDSWKFDMKLLEWRVFKGCRGRSENMKMNVSFSQGHSTSNVWWLLTVSFREAYLEAAAQCVNHFNTPVRPVIPHTLRKWEMKKHHLPLVLRKKGLLFKYLYKNYLKLPSPEISSHHKEGSAAHILRAMSFSCFNVLMTRLYEKLLNGAAAVGFCSYTVYI